MIRTSCLAVVATLLVTATASAQEWADKMFKETSHDFGAVARAAKVEHRFVLKNLYKEDIHIASVRSSCGCTSPRIERETLKTGEEGAIVATFNTLAFTGQRGAQVTVTIDRPYYAEVRLQVRGYIRTDVVLNPGQVALGQVDQGTPVEKKIRIDYAGRNDWQIRDVKTNNPFVTAAVKELGRGGGRVSYELSVQLKPEAPAGYLKDQLLVLTNDQRATQFPVKVDGLVVSEISLSPSSLMLGTLLPGQKVTKQIVIKGKKPFRILDVKCEDESFSFEASDEAKQVHLLPVTFTAGDKPGKVTGRIQIETDVENRPVVEFAAYGNVASPLAGN